MTTLRLLVISGSARTGSYNLQLAQAGASIARAMNAEVTLLDLRALDLPLYDGDIEATQGVPASAQALRTAMRDCDAVFIAAPEYNGFPPPLLINSFAWLSRLKADKAGPAGTIVTTNKPVALVSASPGALGGLRSLNYVRQFLQMAFAMLVVPQQLAVSRAHEAFGDDGALKDAAQHKALENVLASVLRLAQASKVA